MEMSYIGTNQLKFTVSDRRIPSGIRMKPDIHILGGLDNQPGNTVIESRFVAVMRIVLSENILMILGSCLFWITYGATGGFCRTCCRL